MEQLGGITPKLSNIHNDNKGQRYTTNLNLQCHNSTPPPILNHTKLYQRRRVEGRGRRRSEDVRGRREEVQESQGPGSKGSKFQVSQVPRYLKVKFKYELDSKEGPSHYLL